MFNFRIAGLIGTLVGASAAHAQTEETLPLWEAGVGAFALYAPDYPASGSYSLNGLPFPFVVYRGETLRLGGENAARFIPFRSERLELDISVDASFGADSDGNPLREGMEDLDPLFEFGPQLVFNLSTFGEETGRPGKLDFALQGRGVFSLSTDGIDYQGAVVKPVLRYRQRGILGPKTRVTATLGPIFATEGVHDYFYEVSAADATADRPVFDATAGYLGTEMGLSLRYDLNPRLSLYSGLAVGVYKGAENRGSPLFEEDVTASVFVGFAYSFYLSDRRVSVNE